MSSLLAQYLLRFYRQFALRYRSEVVVLGLCAIADIMMGFAQPLVTAYFIDDVIMTGHYSRFWWVFMSYFMLTQLPTVIGIIERRAGILNRERVRRDIRLSLFEKYERLPLKYLQKHPTGELTAKMTNDVDQLDNYMPDAMWGLSADVVRSVIAVILLYYMQWEIALVSVVLVPAYVVVARLFAKPVDDSYAVVLQEYEKDEAQYQGVLQNLFLVKSFVLERLEKSRLGQTMQRFLYAIKRFVRVYLWSYAAVNSIKSLNTFVVWGGGGYLVLTGQLSLGVLIAFSGINDLFFSSVDSITSGYLELKKTESALARIYKVLDEPEEKVEDTEVRPWMRIYGRIEFKDVYFSYRSDEQSVLNGVSFQIEAGEKVALVGTSGSGKSTILNLMARFYEPGKGKILLDGNDIHDYPLSVLRRQVGEVSQHNFIIRGSVAENILFGDVGATQAQMIAAAKAAYAHDFIRLLKAGYDEVIDQNYSNLSGGQLQRIAIARVVLKNPPIVLLDEATASLDPESEELVFKSLDYLARGRTTVVVTHHLATLKKMNRILVLSEGRIVEEGNYDALIKKRGLFYNLVREGA